MFSHSCNGFANKLNNMRKRMKIWLTCRCSYESTCTSFKKEQFVAYTYINILKNFLYFDFFGMHLLEKSQQHCTKDVKCKNNQFKYITEHINITKVIWFLQLSPHIIQTFSMHFLTGFKYSVLT